MEGIVKGTGKAEEGSEGGGGWFGWKEARDGALAKTGFDGGRQQFSRGRGFETGRLAWSGKGQNEEEKKEGDPWPTEDGEAISGHCRPHSGRPVGALG